MVLTVHASVDETARIAARADCDCDLFEEDDERCIVKTVTDIGAMQLARLLNALGIGFGVGRSRGAHSDPTFAAAAQHVDVPDRKVRREA